MSAQEARDRLAVLIPQADVSRTSLPLLRIEAVKILAAADTATALADDLTAGRAAIKAEKRVRALCEGADAAIYGVRVEDILAALDGPAPEPTTAGE